MHGTREAGGIPVETCNSCHNRGKRIGVTYQGLMEFPYGSPYNAQGDKQPKLHTKKYLFISDDLHHQIESRPGNPKGGLLCQDCHTTIDMHGDGNIFGTTLAQVEVECQDCHGTTDQRVRITLDQIRTKLWAPQKLNPLGDRTRFLYPHTLLLYR